MPPTTSSTSTACSPRSRPDAVWVFPAGPAGAPREVSGKEANRSLSLVTVDDGKITRWVEFCDPAPLERGVAVLFGATASA